MGSNGLQNGVPDVNLGIVLVGFRKDFERVLEGFGRLGGHDWRPKWRKFVNMLQVSQGDSREGFREGFGLIWGKNC